MAVKIDLSGDNVYVEKDGIPLVEGQNYTVERNGDNITVQGTSGYIGSVCRIVDPSLGVPRTVTVTDGSYTLIPDVDYTLHDINGSIVLFGKDKYTGAKQITPPQKKQNFAVIFNVTDADGGAPISPFTLYLGLRGSPLAPAALAGNSIELEHGIYECYAAAEGYVQSAPQEFEVLGNRAVSIQLARIAAPVQKHSVAFIVKNALTQAIIANYALTIDGIAAASPALLEAGQHTYSVSATGHTPATSEGFAVSGDMTIVVELTPLSYAVTFNVVDGGGNPIAGYTLTINGDAAASPANLVAGTYNYTVGKVGYTPAPATGTFTVANANITVPVVLTAVAAGDGGVMYWGNNPYAETDGFGWDDMDDAKGGNGWAQYWEWFHTSANPAPYFHSRSITNPETEEIIFTGVGYRFIIVPTPLLRVLDVGGIDVTHIWDKSTITIGGEILHLYTGRVNLSDQIVNTKVTLVWR